MSFGDAIQRRADLLRKRGADMDRIFRETAKGAAMRAVAAAQEKTPPTADDMSGVSTRSGQLKQHWATDSKTVPEVRPHPGGGVEYVSRLGNDMRYASYVDRGHRMDRHFVPGLAVNPVTGKLERVEAKYTDELGISHVRGIVVGTKTFYVQGVFMTDAGHKAFEDTALVELDKIAREVFKP